MTDSKLLKETIQKMLNRVQDYARIAYMGVIGTIDSIKRMIGIMIILCVIVPYIHAFSLFDGLYKKVDDIKEQNNTNNVELSAIKNLTASAIGKIDKLELQLAVNAQAQATALAGVGNKVNNTANTVHGNQSQSTSNDSAIFIKYVESQDKLAKVYEKIIIVLIGQLCALLTLFIRKDEKATTQLIKLISDDNEREDNTHRTTETVTKTTGETLPLSDVEKAIKAKAEGGGN